MSLLTQNIQNQGKQDQKCYLVITPFFLIVIVTIHDETFIQ